MKETILSQLAEIRSAVHAMHLSAQEYLSVEEASRYLKLSRSTLYKHTSQGNIPHYKPNGKLILFRRTDLDDWLNSSRISANKELE